MTTKLRWTQPSVRVELPEEQQAANEGWLRGAERRRRLYHLQKDLTLEALESLSLLYPLVFLVADWPAVLPSLIAMEIEPTGGELHRRYALLEVVAPSTPAAYERLGPRSVTEDGGSQVVRVIGELPQLGDRGVLHPIRQGSYRWVP